MKDPQSQNEFNGCTGMIVGVIFSLLVWYWIITALFGGE